MLNDVKNVGIAKNVILFVADGMDLNTATSTRIQKYKDGETHSLSFDEFSEIGLLKVTITIF